MMMIDIKGNDKDPQVARLSNFTNRPFIFCDVSCAGLEGILQALKCKDFEIQKEICLLSGRDAKRRGLEFDDWKESQLLWWDGFSFERSGREYFSLVTDIYDAAYAQDDSFRTDLLAIGYEDICHSIGNSNMPDTVLTEVEMIYQLNRLRIRALKGHR
jgi:Bacteriophage protein GP30.3